MGMCKTPGGSEPDLGHWHVTAEVLELALRGDMYLVMGVQYETSRGRQEDHR